MAKKKTRTLLLVRSFLSAFFFYWVIALRTQENGGVRYSFIVRIVLIAKYCHFDTANIKNENFFYKNKACAYFYRIVEGRHGGAIGPNVGSTGVSVELTHLPEASGRGNDFAN